MQGTYLTVNPTDRKIMVQGLKKWPERSYLAAAQIQPLY